MAEHPTHGHGPIVQPGGHAPHDTHAGHGAGHDEHHGGIAQYMYVFIALIFLTGCSFFTYSPYWPFRDQPQIGWAFMMAVSCTKAMLVILFFMHILWEANWKFVLTIPAAMMSIFLILALVPDIGMRLRWASEERQFHMAHPQTTGHEVTSPLHVEPPGQQHP